MLKMITKLNLLRRNRLVCFKGQINSELVNTINYKRIRKPNIDRTIKSKEVILIIINLFNLLS